MHSTKWMVAIAATARLLDAQPAAGSISGHITSSISGAGIEGVKVHVACLSGGCTGTDTSGQFITDPAGAFHIGGIPQGRYVIYADKENFELVQTSVTTSTLTITGDARLDLQLTPFASLSGRVVDPDGKPAPGITVDLAGSPKVTDQEGKFTFDKLRPGARPLVAKVKPQPDGKDGERLVTTYYPSALYPEQAENINVQGLDLSGYELRLRTAPARTVRGVALDANAKPVAHVAVVLSKPATPGLVLTMLGMVRPPLAEAAFENVQTGDDGAFEFPAVIEGDWKLRATTSGYREGAPGRTVRTGAIDIRVGKSDIDNLELRIVQPFQIEVTADWGDSPPASPPFSLASVMPLDGQAFNSPNGESPQRTDGFPGRYLVAPATPPPGYYAAAAIMEGRDVLGQAVNLFGPTAIKMVYKNDGGSVRGAVEKGAGAMVVLMADPSPAARFGLQARCDADGNFSIPNVPPGRYTVAAFAQPAFEEVYSNQASFLSRVDARGERVDVNARAATMVTLKVN